MPSIAYFKDSEFSLLIYALVSLFGRYSQRVQRERCIIATPNISQEEERP